MMTAENIAEAFDTATREFTESPEFRLLASGDASGEVALEFLRNVFRTHYLSSHIVALCFAGLAALRPQVMRPLNFIWYKFGLALHHIVNPVLMGLIYFGAVVPMGLIMQLRGKDALRMKNGPPTDSYWIRRLPPLPAETLHKQF